MKLGEISAKSKLANFGIRVTDSSQDGVSGASIKIRGSNVSEDFRRNRLFDEYGDHQII